MKFVSKFSIVLGLLLFLCQPIYATTISYEATNISGNQWAYSYTVSDNTFAADTGFTIYFDLGLYDLLDPAPTAPNTDWDVLTWDPDSSLPDDGAYDAYAMVVGASLADAFTVNFVWLGAGTPGEQFFEVYDGLTWEVLESGETTAASAAPVPEPATIFLIGTGLLGIIGIRRKK